MEQRTNSSSLFFSHNSLMQDPNIFKKIFELRSYVLELPSIDPTQLTNKPKLDQILNQNVDAQKVFNTFNKEYISLLLSIVGADGKVDEKERQSLRQNLIMLAEGRLTDEQIKELDNHADNYINSGAFKTADITQLVNTVEEGVKKLGIKANVAKSAIYHAAVAARADGEFSSEEKAAVKNLANILKVDAKDYELILKLARVETRLNNIPTSSLNLASKGGKEGTPQEELDDLYNSVFQNKSSTPHLSK